MTPGSHDGGCHCRNIRVVLRLSKPPEGTPLRACGCSFCHAHETRTAADPGGLFELRADDWSLVEPYRFGSRTAEYILCRRIGGASRKRVHAVFRHANQNALERRLP